MGKTIATISAIAALAVAAVMAAGGAANASPASQGPAGSIIHATGVHPGAIRSISSSTGNLTLKATGAYADLTSDNWSGYVTPQVSQGYGATFTTFTVPADITCGSTDTASSFWGGLDGWGDETVEQDGVEVDCTGGSPSLYAWVETYPAPELEISNSTTGTAAPVEPGDSFSASVVEISPAEYSFSLDDDTQRWSFATNLDMPSGTAGEDLTSEVITEATTECPTPATCSIMPLTSFGSVSYGDALYFDGSGNTDYFYTSSDATRIDLYQNGAEADSVGALGADGAFAVTYGPPDQVTVTSPANQSATVGAAVHLQIHATSSNGEALSYAASGLPPGLSISSTTGLVSGTPRAAGTYVVDVGASDPTGITGSGSFTWTVKNLSAPKPHLCGTRTGTRLEVCWAAVAHATSYSGNLYGHSFTTTALHEVFRGLKPDTTYRLQMQASNAAGSSAVVVLSVRTRK